MTDPVGDIIGNYHAFAAQQRDRLLTRGIDISPYTLGHLCYRVPRPRFAAALDAKGRPNRASVVFA
jgi:hypothetical protein